MVWIDVDASPHRWIDAERLKALLKKDVDIDDVQKLLGDIEVLRARYWVSPPVVSTTAHTVEMSPFVRFRRYAISWCVLFRYYSG